MPSDYFAVLAQHNAWANRRLLQSCEALAPAEYLRERGSVYGSLHAALNHILATDRLWIGRIEGRSRQQLMSIRSYMPIWSPSKLHALPKTNICGW